MQLLEVVLCETLMITVVLKINLVGNADFLILWEYILLKYSIRYCFHNKATHQQLQQIPVLTLSFTSATVSVDKL
jgi:hypothetical protein